MPNVSSANGYYYDSNLYDESPAVHDYPIKASTTLNPGDAVTFDAGQLVLAVTTDTVLGVVVGPAAVDDTVYSDGGAIVAGAGENPLVKVIIATAGTLFRVHDANAAPTAALVGVSVDMVGAAGAQGVDSSSTTTGDVQLFDIAGPDNIAGNEFGADMQWLGIFKTRYFV